MPVTPVYSFPTPAPGEPPDVPVDMQDLADAVETEVARIDVDVSDHGTRLAALEAGTSMVGWVPIQSGFNSGATFNIDLTDDGRFTIGEFQNIRLHMRYELDDPGGVFMRINADTTAVYTWGMRVLDAANQTDAPVNMTRAAFGIDDLSHVNGNSWRIGWGATVSNNNLICTIFHTNGNNLHSFQATSNRMSTSATTHAEATAWGNLTGALSATPSSLRMFTASGATSYTNAWWWAEGYRVPA